MVWKIFVQALDVFPTLADLAREPFSTPELFSCSRQSRDKRQALWGRECKRTGNSVDDGARIKIPVYGYFQKM